MNLTKVIIHYLLTTVAFFAIDLVWLGFIAQNMYKKHVGHLMADKVNMTAAMSFYLLYVVAVLILVVYPAVEKESLLRAAALGCVLGFIAYATYDLTNLATLKDWPAWLSVVDIIWGSILTTTVSIAGYFIVKGIN